jgi:hypothetical protein
VNGIGLADQIDELYRRAIESPSAIDDPVLAEWSESAFESTGGDREAAKSLRRAVRTARKLSRYWSTRDPDVLPDWRNGVDEALGGLGWEAQLGVLMAALDTGPDSEIFEAVKARYRQVHFTEWMEGISYEEWVAERSG